MPLGKNADAGDYIKDFEKSKAPQFKGKSKEKRRKMAIAAYLDSKDKKESKMKSFDDIRTELDEISSNKLSDYMRKSAADAAKRGPGQSARRQDKRIAGQSMADKKIRKKMGYSSDAKVPAGKNESADEGFTKKAVETGKVKTGASNSRIKAIQKQDDNRPTLRKNEGKKMDSAAMKRAMDAYKKRGGKITKVAPGKAAGYHGKDDPGKGMHGMMDKGDTKNMPKKKFMGSMK